MNELAQSILGEAATRLLAADLAQLEETACEFLHGEDPRNGVCSHKVTHRCTATCIGDGALICTNAAEIIRKNFTDGASCNDCHRKAQNCFELVPV